MNNNQTPTPVAPIPDESSIFNTNGPTNPSAPTPTKGPRKVNGKVIATLFGILLLVSAVVAGGIAVQNQQTIRNQAASSACEAGVCNDGFTYGRDCNAPQPDCPTRNKEACKDHNGWKSGGGTLNPAACAAVTPTNPPAGTTPNSYCTGTKDNPGQCAPTSKYVWPGPGCQQPNGTFLGRCCAAGDNSCNTSTPAPPPGTGGTGTGTNVCPSGYSYCGNPINSCINTNQKDSFTCSQLIETWNTKNSDGTPNTSSTPLCPDSPKAYCPGVANLSAVGTITCKQPAESNIVRCCLGGNPVNGYCPGFGPNTNTNPNPGGTTGTCGASGQTCCNPFTSPNGLICNANLYCNTATGTCQTTPPTNLCSGGSGTPGTMCEVYTCGNKCNNGNQCNLNKQVVPCSSATLNGQCGQIDFLNTTNGYCGVKSQNCGASCQGTTSTPPPGGTPTPITAQCQGVKAYDTNWKLLTVTDLSAMKAGDKVRFTVMGVTTSGIFDKARFAINGATAIESTLTKPGSGGEFYYEYTIPAGTTSFTVTGQVHHQQLNTWN